MKHTLLFITCLSIMGTCLHTYAEDHLEPLPVFLPSEPLFGHLLHDTKPSLWMISLPSFSAENAIILDEKIEYREEPYEPTDTMGREVASRRYVLTYVSFKKNQWHEANQRVLTGLVERDQYPDFENIDPSNAITRYTLPVDEEFASTIEEAWASVLKQTKYPEKHRMGLDGTRYFFYCDWYYGHIWSPDTGLAEKLVELGNNLRTLVMSDEEDRELIKTQCRKLAVEIINKPPTSGHTLSLPSAAQSEP